MKQLLAWLSVGVATALLVSADEVVNDDACTPGSTFKNDCNSCICGQDGLRSRSACTLIGCLPPVNVTDWLINDDACTPGSTFKNDCNSCICSREGLRSRSACTLMACLPTLNVTGTDACWPGETFIHECNTCNCGPEGKRSTSACTDMACFHHVSERDATTEEEDADDECLPGTTFKEGCNTCTCGNGGLKSTSSCTLMACINYINSRDPPTTCKPFTNFLDECNTCMCGSDGLRVNAACTSMTCPLKPLSRSKRDGERCAPGSHFKDDCNACICGQDGIRDHASCTFHVCPEMIPCPSNEVYCVPVFAVPVDGERCAPGGTFMDDCNTCICAQDGIKTHASCTFKDCSKMS